MTSYRQDPPGGPDPEPIAEPLRPTWQSAEATTGPSAASGAEPAMDVPVTPVRSGGPSKTRVGLVAGAAAALAVGAVATSFAATPPPATPQAPAAVTGGGVPALAVDPAVDELDDAFELGRFGGIGFRDITIKAISGSNVTLETADGWTRTIAVTGSVTITKGGQEIALSDLAVGDQVRIRQTRNDDGTFTVTAIAVVVPTVRGTVSDLTDTSFKLTTRDGAVWTITTNGQTDYYFGGAEGSRSDVQDGEVALVAGQSTGDNALTALSVTVAADRAVGTVTAKTASTITIRTRDGSTVTVKVDGDTQYRVAGVEDAGLDDIAVDMVVGVQGRRGSDGSIDANAVVAGRGLGRAGGLPGFGGRGGHGLFDWGDKGPSGDDRDDAGPSPSPTQGS
jgi:hypothetical protein